MSEEHLKAQGTACATATYQDIHNLLSGCQRFGLMGAVVGDPGTGKTTAAKAYGEGRRQVVYYRIRKAAASMRHFLVHLNEQVGGYSAREFGTDDFYKEVLDCLLRLKEQGGMLILDEVQDLEPDAKDVIRNLFEDSAIGICLIGNRDLLTPNFKRGRASQNVQRLLGRIGPKILLDKPMPEDIAAICAFHGISGKEAVRLVGKIATSGQQLHNLDYLLRVARETCSQDRPLTLETLKNAALLTGGGA